MKHLGPSTSKSSSGLSNASLFLEGRLDGSLHCGNGFLYEGNGSAVGNCVRVRARASIATAGFGVESENVGSDSTLRLFSPLSLTRSISPIAWIVLEPGGDEGGDGSCGGGDGSSSTRDALTLDMSCCRQVVEHRNPHQRIHWGCRVPSKAQAIVSQLTTRVDPDSETDSQSLSTETSSSFSQHGQISQMKKIPMISATIALTIIAILDPESSL